MAEVIIHISHFCKFTTLSNIKRTTDVVITTTTTK